MEESSKLGMPVCESTRDFCRLCTWNDIKLAGKKHIESMWKHLMKKVDLGEPTSFLDNVYLGCTYST